MKRKTDRGTANEYVTHRSRTRGKLRYLNDRLIGRSRYTVATFRRRSCGLPLAKSDDSHFAIADLQAMPVMTGSAAKIPSWLSGTPSASWKYVGAHDKTTLNSQSMCATCTHRIATVGRVVCEYHRKPSVRTDPQRTSSGRLLLTLPAAARQTQRPYSECGRRAPSLR